MAENNNPTTPKVKGPRKGVKLAFLIVTWIILGAIGAQVLFIGLGILYNSPTFLNLHVGMGYTIGHFAPLLLIVGFFGRLGRSLTTLNAVTFVLFAALPFLAAARYSAGAGQIVSGLHPLTALLIFSLTLYMSLRVKAMYAALNRRAAVPARAPMTATAPPAVAGRVPPPANR